MPVDRPTFSESWYRVQELRPRLRATVQTYRQHYRGQLWHVVQDHASNQYFRLTEPAYQFLALLDGRRTVGRAWHLCNERLGDDAPTQNEVIQLLGQLYTSNLIQAELPADAEGMFERYRKRVRREVGGYVMNFLFVRIPLVDPDRLLDRWLPVFSWFFGPVGFVVWAILLAVGGYHLIGRGADFFAGAMDILAVENLILLYLCLAGVKFLHEMGHGLSCKRFGQMSGGGEVHTLGIMFLVFMPVPYVDASSAWAFRNKWQRAFVGAAGMYVELAVAAIAAVVWARTGGESLVHALAFNVMFIAGVSTVLFNGNPLLRFDGYYIFSDVFELANLSRRSRDYFFYLVKRYVYGVRRPVSPANTRGERYWLLFYHIASLTYRVFILIAILGFIASFFLIAALFLGAAVLTTWFVVPLGKWVKYLATSEELSRVRWRAVTTSIAMPGVVVAGLTLVPVPDRGRAEGVVEPEQMAVIHAGVDGFVRDFLPEGTFVDADQESPLVSTTNAELESDLRRLLSYRDQMRVQYLHALTEDRALAQTYAEQRRVIERQIADRERRLALLELGASQPGFWVFAPERGRLERGAYVEHGEAIGLVAQLDRVLIRAIADQRLGPRIVEAFADGTPVEMRVQGRPDQHFTGTIRRILPAGQQRLPSRALGYQAGGEIQVDEADPEGLATQRRFFELHIEPSEGEAMPALLSGQRVVVRFTFEPAPLGRQLYRWVRQVLQERFEV